MKTIFLHGLGQSSYSWNAVIKGMKQPSHILCPDLYSMVCDDDICYSHLYKAFTQYCTKLSAPFHICGLSLGCIMALQYCIEHPDKINAMTLIGTQYAMPKGLLKLQNFIFRVMPEKSFKNTKLHKKAFISLSKSMMDLNFQPYLKTIACPVLIVCGEKDTVNKKAALQLKEQIPLSQLCIIANAGHEVNVDAPEQLSCVINDFLQW